MILSQSHSDHVWKAAAKMSSHNEPTRRELYRQITGLLLFEAVTLRLQRKVREAIVLENTALDFTPPEHLGQHYLDCAF